MPILRATAITIARADYSETSQVVTFYTREHGKTPVLAKGSKRPKNKLGGPLDLLSLCDILFVPRGGSLSILTECETADHFSGLRRSLPHMFAGLYAAELVGRMTQESDPNPALFDTLLETLRALADGVSPELARVSFELRSLKLAGYLPEFERCVSCGRRVREGRRAFFCAAAGGVICGGCRKDSDVTTPMNPGLASPISRLLATPPAELGTLAVPKQMLAGISRLVRQQLLYVLETEPRLMRYVTR